MLPRSSIAGLGALGGATAVCALALVLGPPGSVLGALDGLQARLIAVRPPAPTAKAAPASAASAFTLFGSGVAPTLRLDGVALSPGRRAALMSIDGAPADWIEAGDTRDGVTVVEVRSDEVVVDSDAGSKTVKLGDGPPAPAAATAPKPPHLNLVPFSPPLPGQVASPSPLNLAGRANGPPLRPGTMAPPTAGLARPPVFAAPSGAPPQPYSPPPSGRGPG